MPTAASPSCFRRPAASSVAVSRTCETCSAEPKKRRPCRKSRMIRSPSLRRARSSQTGRLVRPMLRCPELTPLTGRLWELCQRKSKTLSARPVPMPANGDQAIATAMQASVMPYSGDGSRSCEPRKLTFQSLERRLAHRTLHGAWRMYMKISIDKDGRPLC